MPTIGVWSDLEIHIDIWCGCFPAMQPILRRWLGSRARSPRVSWNEREQRRSRDKRGHQRSGDVFDTTAADEDGTTTTAVGYSRYAESVYMELGQLDGETPATATEEGREGQS